MKNDIIKWYRKKLLHVIIINMILIILFIGFIIYHINYSLNPLGFPIIDKEYDEENYNCQDFSLDFAKLLKEQGYEVYIVTGYIPNMNHSHAWVEVVIPIEPQYPKILKPNKIFPLYRFTIEEFEEIQKTRKNNTLTIPDRYRIE